MLLKHTQLFIHFTPKIGRHHLNSSFAPHPQGTQALLWTWRYYVICCNGRKSSWKTCMLLQREIIIHTIAFTTKEAFHFKLRAGCWFPKSYWLKMAQLRSGRAAMNRDSRSSFPPFSSCELYCCLVLMGREGRSCIWRFSWDLTDSAVTPRCAWVYSSERFHVRRAMRTTFSKNTLCTHAPAYTNCHHRHPSPSGFISWTWDHRPHKLVTDKQLLVRCSADVNSVHINMVNMLTSFLLTVYNIQLTEPVFALLPPHAPHVLTLTDNWVGGRNVIYLNIKLTLASNMTDTLSGLLSTDGLQKGFACLPSSPSVAP